MNIRFATDGDTEALKKMWLDTFSDSKQFVDWNFENNYTPKNVMICEKDGKIASSLHLIPYTLTLSGKTLNAVYISAVATLPEFRGLGCASAVISAALENIRKSGKDLAFLIPAISGFYERLGFSYILKKKTLIFKPCRNTVENISFSDTSNISKAALGIYSNVCRCKKLYLDRSKRDMSLITSDLINNTGGYLKILPDKSGYIMYKEFSSCIELYEIMATSSYSKNLLLNYLLSFNKKIKQVLPPVMVKALNTETKKAIGTYPKDISRKNAYFNLIL